MDEMIFTEGRSENGNTMVEAAIQTDDLLSCESANELSSTNSSSSVKNIDNPEDLFQANLKKDSSAVSSINLSSAENSNGSTRRNSHTSYSSSSDLGTPLQFLFRSSSSSISNGSHVDSPVGLSPEADVLNGLDRLLHRITSERFLELRRIQLGERPVTNGIARENLENFFHRAINGPSEEQRISEDQANRPENVANDVQSLLQLSRVQSALQSGFSNQLESALGFRIQQSVRPTGHVLNQNPLQHIRRGNSTSIIHTRREQIVTQEVPPPPPPPMTPQFTNRNVQPTPQSALQSTVDASVELLAESIATDITRLQSLQVVSSMLSTDFRTELENLVQQRVQNGNGAQVAEFIQSLPRTRRPPVHVQRNRDSSINQNSSEGSSHLSSEVNHLCQQLDEMKRMMAMSMEIQMDTQRAIRQEVAAIFSSFMQDYLLPSRTGQNVNPQPALVQPRNTRPIQAGQCVICVDRSVDTVLYHCGHMCVCNQCGLQLKINGHKCPMCRAPIQDVIRAYQS